jgi:hypothetical protein
VDGYGWHLTPPRKVDNTDNTTPENHSENAVPGLGAEWCYKNHGHSVGVSSGTGLEWGPFSKIYCIARSGGGSGVFVTSDRNGTANFRVYNFSGAAIVDVQLRTDPPPGISDLQLRHDK